MRGNPVLLAVLAIAFGLGAGCSAATGGTTSGGSTGTASGGGSSTGGSTGGASTTGSTGGSSTGGGSTTGGTGGSSTGGTTTGGGKVAGAPCSGDAECASTVCGVNGGGRCCVARCDTSDPICDATACDGQGACVYPTSQLQCRAPSCAGDTLTEEASCDGAGKCPALATTDCTPYACSGTPAACATRCTAGDANCASGGFCDFDQLCCSGLASGGTIAVDGATGADGTCCGIGTNQACQTLNRAMQLIDEARAQNVTIVATVTGGGGDWPMIETFPVRLGWGVVLSAPGVFFGASAAPPALEVFDVATYSVNDTLGTASIVGSAQSPVGVGMDSANSQQANVDAVIRVETGATLYLANASVNGSEDNGSAYSALTVSAGATLVLGQDQSGNITGTVTIGNALGAEATDGNLGILCDSDQVSTGCTIKDAALKGQSSVVIQGQEHGAIYARDFSTISLTSNPVIGVPPRRAGFDKCPQKNDAIGSHPAVFLQGEVTMTFNNGVVQCLGGTGFWLDPTPFGKGVPTLNIDNTVIQNTEVGILSHQGKAIVTNTTIQYNVIGVEQGQDVDGNNGNVDLSGGGNTVVCSSNKESSQSYAFPGIDVYNVSTANLNASNVAWDTPDPDYFDCDQDFSCTCANGFSCVTAPGSDDMDAVEDSTLAGGITTTGASQSQRGCY